MELVLFAKEVIQNVAEQVASYRLGQTALRYLDRTLWVVEKCARWAVPPPLDQDDRPQPELVRPLPWVFFLALLLALRVTRESISLFNLVLGKPPLRSADVVMIIQSKRRYLRTLKYQGNRMIRARTSAPSSEPWYSSLQSLFEFTMCFRRSHNYGNNNTTRVSNNDEVLVVKRMKRPKEQPSPVASTSESTMERLIEKMMVDLDAESDDDSSFTLTNATSVRSDDSETDQETLGNPNDDTLHDDTLKSIKSIDTSNDNNVSPTKKEFASSTPEKDSEQKHEETKTTFNDKGEVSYNETSTEEKPKQTPNCEDKAFRNTKQNSVSPNSSKQETNNFIMNERNSPKKSIPSPKKKIANGRSNSSPNKMKAATENDRLDSGEVPLVRISAPEN